MLDQTWAALCCWFCDTFCTSLGDIWWWTSQDFKFGKCRVKLLIPRSFSAAENHQLTIYWEVKTCWCDQGGGVLTTQLYIMYMYYHHSLHSDSTVCKRRTSDGINYKLKNQMSWPLTSCYLYIGSCFDLQFKWPLFYFMVNVVKQLVCQQSFNNFKFDSVSSIWSNFIPYCKCSYIISEITKIYFSICSS